MPDGDQQALLAEVEEVELSGREWRGTGLTLWDAESASLDESQKG